MRPTRKGSAGTKGASRSAASPLKRLADNVDKWLKDVGRLLVPPFHESKDQDLVKPLISIVQCEAASLFLIDPSDPTRLKYVSGDGYKEGYSAMPYSLDTRALTSHVFNRRSQINESKQSLQQQPDTESKIPLTNRCENYLQSGEFRNIVAVAVELQGIRLGVLKFENKIGKSACERFPSEDLALARIVANIVAIRCQQAIYQELWNRAESLASSDFPLEDFLDRMARILRDALKAEACSFFILDEDPVSKRPQLEYRGGSGYDKKYEAQVYSLDDDKDDIPSFTTHVVRSRQTRRMTKEQILEAELPYSGQCSSWLPSMEHRNILAVPLMGSTSNEHIGMPCHGVLKLENKQPGGTEFSKNDEEICDALVTRLIVPALQRWGAKSRKGRNAREAHDVLVRQFGAPEESARATKALFEEVMRFKETHKAIRHRDVQEYLHISHSTYYRWLGLVKKARPGQGAPSETVENLGD